MCLVPCRSEEGTRSPGTSVRQFAPPCGYWESKTRSSEKPASALSCWAISLAQFSTIREALQDLSDYFILLKLLKLKLILFKPNL